jgi:uncharacterized membrane protein (UPF0182 family)
LLQKVLVNFGDRIGYADTLAEALDQVFGAGAGEVAADSGAEPTPDGTPAPTTPAEPTSPETPAPGGGAATGPDMDAAVTDIRAALDALKTAQATGDFEGQGRALADLEAAVKAYQAAQQAGAAESPGG